MYKENISKNDLKQKTGIDLEQYRTDDIAMSLNDLIETPITVLIHFILWPLLLMTLICATGIFFVWPISWAGGLFWILTGLIIGPLSGISIAAYIVALNLSEASQKLYAATLDTIKIIAADLKDNYHQIPENQPLPTYKEWIRIVQLALIVPVVRELIRRKLWPLGHWIGNTVVVNLTQTSQKSELVLLAAHDSQQPANREQLQAYSDKIIKNTEMVKNNLDKAHKNAMKLTLSPIRFTMFMTLALNVFIMIIIWYFFL
jgi:hypothetical protein